MCERERETDINPGILSGRLMFGCVQSKVPYGGKYRRTRVSGSCSLNKSYFKAFPHLITRISGKRPRCSENVLVSRELMRIEAGTRNAAVYYTRVLYASAQRRMDTCENEKVFFSPPPPLPLRSADHYAHAEDDNARGRAGRRETRDKMRSRYIRS